MRSDKCMGRSRSLTSLLLLLVICAASALLLRWYSVHQVVVHSVIEADLGRRWNISNFDNQFYVITMLSLYCGHKWPGYEKFTVDDLNTRDQEYLVTLDHNINHPLVKEVHLFYTDDEALNVVKQQRFHNRYKIVPVKTERRIHMMDFFHYAGNYLIDKPVIALNGDIVIGEGFDQINTVKMRDNKVFYSLTRHGHTKGNCSVENYCLDRKYQGSHDTHIFRLANHLDESLLLRLDYPINSWQAENGLLGAFKFYFNYKIYNPCQLLKTYHFHCSPVHKQGKHNSIKDPPYNWKYEQLAKAAPTGELLY